MALEYLTGKYRPTKEPEAVKNYDIHAGSNDRSQGGLDGIQLPCLSVPGQLSILDPAAAVAGDRRHDSPEASAPEASAPEATRRTTTSRPTTFRACRTIGSDSIGYDTIEDGEIEKVESPPRQPSPAAPTRDPGRRAPAWAAEWATLEAAVTLDDWVTFEDVVRGPNPTAAPVIMALAFLALLAMFV